jgi:DNA-binding CsgD family transcriptional regulator
LFNLGDGIILALLEQLHFNQNYYRIFFTIIPYVVIPIVFIIIFKKINNSQLWVSIGAGLLIIGFILYNFSSSTIIISILGMILLDIILWGIGLMLNIVYKRSFILVAFAIGSNSLATFIGYISTISYYKNIAAISVCFAVACIAAVIGILLIPTLYNSIVNKCVNTYKKNLSIRLDRKNIEQIAKSYSLTNKEIEIFTLLLNKYRYNQIASEMNISLNTVKTHIKHIYSKIDVSSKKELLSKISSV